MLHNNISDLFFCFKLPGNHQKCDNSYVSDYVMLSDLMIVCHV